MGVRAKKYLGQHFLKDKNIARKIAGLIPTGISNVLEIGPGTGVLTNFLKDKKVNLKVIEIDSESVDYLIKNNILPEKDILFADFLKTDIRNIFGGEEFVVTGNFPYNISSQILFKTLEYREMIPFFSGMFQKEVGERITAKAGNKTYGILSVLSQAFYDTSYLFTLKPSVFLPPPKVDSGVIKMVRKEDFQLDCNEDLFFKVVKTAFNTRRKMMRSSLKTIVKNKEILSSPVFEKRPEQLDFKEFEGVVRLIEGR